MADAALGAPTDRLVQCGQRPTQPAAAGDVELAVHAAEMGLDGLARHEQGLRDLRVAVPFRGELGDSALGDRELGQPACFPTGPAAGRRASRCGHSWQGRGRRIVPPGRARPAACVSRAARRSARRSAAPRSVSARACSSCAGECARVVHRLAQEIQRPRTAIDERGRAQARPRSHWLRPSAEPAADRRQPWRAPVRRHRGRRGEARPGAPARCQRVGASPLLVAAAELEQVVRPARVLPWAKRSMLRASSRGLVVGPGGISSPGPLSRSAFSATSGSPASRSASIRTPSAAAPERDVCVVSRSSDVRASTSARATAPVRIPTYARWASVNATAGIETWRVRRRASHRDIRRRGPARPWPAGRQRARRSGRLRRSPARATAVRPRVRARVAGPLRHADSLALARSKASAGQHQTLAGVTPASPACRSSRCIAGPRDRGLPPARGPQAPASSSSARSRSLRLDDPMADSSASTARSDAPDDRQRVRELTHRDREQLRLADQLDRRHEVLDRAGPPTEVLPSRARAARTPGIRRRGLGKRPAETGDSGRGCTAHQRIGGDPTQQFDSFGIAEGFGRDDLSSDPLLGGAGVARIAAARACATHALGGTDVRVDRFPHDRMGELDPLGRREDRERHQQVGGPAASSVGELGTACRLGEARAVSEHRDGAYECGRGAGSPGKPEQHRLSHRGGADAPHPIGRFHVGTAPSARSLRAAAPRGGNGLPPVAVAAGGSELRRHGRAEPARAQPPAAAALSGRGRSTVVSGAAASRRAPRCRPRRARRGEHGQRETIQARRQVREEPQRLGVGPVQVVDGQGDRTVGSQVVEQPVETVQNGVRGIGRGTGTPPVGVNSGVASGGRAGEEASTLIVGLVTTARAAAARNRRRNRAPAHWPGPAST